MLNNFHNYRFIKLSIKSDSRKTKGIKIKKYIILFSVYLPFTPFLLLFIFSCALQLLPSVLSFQLEELHLMFLRVRAASNKISPFFFYLWMSSFLFHFLRIILQDIGSLVDSFFLLSDLWICHPTVFWHPWFLMRNLLRILFSMSCVMSLFLLLLSIFKIFSYYQCDFLFELYDI